MSSSAASRAYDAAEGPSGLLPLEAALVWGARGVPVFPVAISWNERKNGTDKRPLTDHGHQDASTDVTVVRALFAEADRRLRSGEVLGVGGVPGRADHVVFDLDRHGGPDGVAFGNDVLQLPRATFRLSTGSSGEHRWLEKCDRDVEIGNVSSWDGEGVNVRADMGWVVLAAETPWGIWGPHRDSLPWDEGRALVPDDVWETLVGPNTSGATKGRSEAVSPWTSFDPDTHFPRLHPSVPRLLEVLKAEGATVLSFREREGGEPYLELTCDGANVSATLGYIGPCGLNVFSASWPGRPSGPQSVDRDLVPVPLQSVIADSPQRWVDPREGLLTADITGDIIRDMPVMRDLGDGVWVHIGGVWRPDRASWVRTAVTRRLGNRSRPAHTKAVTHFLLGTAPVLACEPVPEYVNVPNGLLDWTTGTLRPHNPEVLSTVQLPTRWVPSAECPLIEAWLAEVLPADLLEPTVDGPGFIWEVIGYLCFSGNPLHKAILLLGSGRNGKGTFLRLLTALLGEENVSNVDLHSLVNNRFRAAELFGKVANIAGDLDGAWLESTALFKAITGGDAIQAERKYGAPFDFRPFAVPVYSANKVFGTPDTTDGYLSRWLVIPFPHSFLGQEDRTLDSRLQQPDELEGLLARAVVGLRAVLARGNFDVPPSVAAAEARFADESDPVRVFITDVSEPKARAWVARETIWRIYRAWCEESGQRKPLTRTQLYARLTAAGWLQSKRQGDRGFVDRRLTVEAVEGNFGHFTLLHVDD